MSNFITGFVGGFAIAAPVGPIGMLCIRRSVTDGRLVGFACGLGAATADVCYGAVAAFGLSTVSQFLLSERMWIQLVGGLFLAGLGISIIRSQPTKPESRSGASRGLSAAYGSTLVLTLMNPMTILSFIGVFAAVGFGIPSNETSTALLLVLGVFLGSVSWWIIVSLAGGWLGDRLEHGGLRVVNWVAGSIVFLFGIGELVVVARHLVK